MVIIFFILMLVSFVTYVWQANSLMSLGESVSYNFTNLERWRFHRINESKVIFNLSQNYELNEHQLKQLNRIKLLRKVSILSLVFFFLALMGFIIL